MCNDFTQHQAAHVRKYFLFLSDSLLLVIPDHFITDKPETSFVNTQVITDKIQGLIKRDRP